MRVSHTPLFFVVLSVALYSVPYGAHAQPVEYGTSAVAFVDTAGTPDGPNSDLNLEGTFAAAHAESGDAVADARVRIDSVSCLSEITDLVDSDALTYDAFLWDTFSVTSESVSNGTPTTVSFLLGLDAALTASSSDPLVDIADVWASMIVGVYDAILTDGVPTEGPDLFVGTADLDAVSGLVPGDDLAAAPFTVEAVSGGFTATLSDFTIPIDVPTTVGSDLSVKLSVETGASVAPLLTDGIAIADLRNSLRILAIDTEEGIELTRASGAMIPPVPLQVTPVLVTVLPTVGFIRFARRSRTVA